MEILRTSILLLETNPTIRRVVDVPAEITLAEFHIIIQAAMGWENSHAYAFYDAALRYGSPGLDNVIPATSKTLVSLAKGAEKQLTYVYDFGDNWRHELTIEPVPSPDLSIPYPRLVDAVGRCPPEDVGGVSGFKHFLFVMGKPTHKEHADLRKWNGGPFNKADPDKTAIEKTLATLAKLLTRKAKAARQTSSAKKLSFDKYS